MLVSFAMLLNLASAANAQDKAVLWGFIRRYAPEASPETHPHLDAAAGHAVRYFEDFVRPAQALPAADAREAAALADLRDRLAAWEGPAEAEGLQNLVFAVGNAHGFDPLRAWFAAIYEVLLGAEQGPRFGGFIALYGVPETIALIDAALRGGWWRPGSTPPEAAGRASGGAGGRRLRPAVPAARASGAARRTVRPPRGSNGRRRASRGGRRS